MILEGLFNNLKSDLIIYIKVNILFIYNRIQTLQWTNSTLAKGMTQNNCDKTSFFHCYGDFGEGEREWRGEW